MMTSSRGWFAAFVVVVFLAGTSVGVVVDRVWLLRNRFAGPQPIGTAVGLRGLAPEGGSVVVANGAVETNVRRLRDRLNLTADQEAAVRPLVQAWMERVRALQDGTRESLLAEVNQFEAALAAVSPALTADQRERLTSMRSVFVIPNPRARGRLGGPEGGRGARGEGRGGGFRPGGPGRE